MGVTLWGPKANNQTQVYRVPASLRLALQISHHLGMKFVFARYYCHLDAKRIPSDSCMDSASCPLRRVWCCPSGRLGFSCPIVFLGKFKLFQMWFCGRTSESVRRTLGSVDIDHLCITTFLEEAVDRMRNGVIFLLTPNLTFFTLSEAVKLHTSVQKIAGICTVQAKL